MVGVRDAGGQGVVGDGIWGLGMGFLGAIR